MAADPHAANPYLQNLLLGVEQKQGADADLDAAHAFEIARQLGLPGELLHAPEGFTVGKGGRNLTMTARQLVCIARAILADPDVLMLYNPTALLSHVEADRVLLVLHAFTERGGLAGLLDPDADLIQGDSESHYLTGNGRKTVLFTMSSREEQLGVPDVVAGVVMCQETWDLAGTALSAESALKDPRATASLGFSDERDMRVIEGKPLARGRLLLQEQPGEGNKRSKDKASMSMAAIASAVNSEGGAETDGWKQRLRRVHESRWWTAATLTCTLWALGGDDLYLLADPPMSLDRPIFSMYFISFLQFASDLASRCLLQPSFLFSFFFWLDAVAALYVF